ncbi:MAG: serine hydrolase [Cytophagales bacterium]|tara:strand:- start:1018 stop:2505 length:1488 start_codon:yes stop_codon:yes gene_type:complete
MFRTVFFLFLLFSINLFSQSKINILDDFILEGKEMWKIPGISVVVVKNDSTLYKKTFGKKNFFDDELVDSETIFSMASTTKAFISMSLGILVDRDSISWDDRVVDILPSFKLSDPYITKDARIKDLLTHNLGIGNEDRLWTTDSTSVEEMLLKFSKSPRKYPLRGGYTYQNIMYVVAGQVISKVSGISWQSFVKTNILDKVGLSCTLTWSKDIFEYGNYTFPHQIDYEEGIVHVPFTISDQIGAAGMMWSCSDDMEKYLKFLLNETQLLDERILDKKTFNYLFKPQIIVGDSFYPTAKLTNPNWKTYGLGWYQHDYRGEKIDFHTGSLQGLVAIIGLIRDRNIGVQVFANLDHAELRHAIMYKVMDLFVFSDDSRDWNREVYNLYNEMDKKYKKSYLDKFILRDENSKMTLKLIDYSGTYENDMYGRIIVSVKDEKMTLDVNNGVKFFDLEWWEKDVFITDKDEKWREKLFVKFNLNNNSVRDLTIYNAKFKKVN